MDENRMNSYLHLIQKLRECTEGDKPQIFKANAQLLEPKIVEKIIALAKESDDNDNQNDAVFLTNLALEIGEFIGSDRQSIEIRKETADILFNWGKDKFHSQLMVAFYCWQKCLIIYQGICDSQGEASCLINLGHAYYSQESEEALNYYQQSLLISREIKNRQKEAVALGGLGNVYFFMGQIEKAIDYHQQSLNIGIEINDHPVKASSLGSLGNVYESRGEYEKAIDYHKQHLAICVEINDPRGEATCLNNLGIAYLSVGEYKKAIDYHQKSFSISNKINDPRGKASSLGGLGNACLFLGEIEEAIIYHKKSLVIKHQIKDPRGEANSLGSLGTAYDCLGQYEKAIDYHKQHLAISQEIKDPRGEANSLGNLGNAYDSLGEYEKAIDYHKQHLAISQEIKDRRGEASSLGGLGNAYNSLKQYKEAIHYHEKCLAISKEISDSRGQAAALGNLGLAYQLWEQYEQAIHYYEKCLEISKELSDSRGQAAALGNLGLAYQLWEQTEVAIKNFLDCLKIATSATMPAECFIAGRSLGHIGFNQGDSQLALQGYEPAMQAVEQLRKGSTTDKRREKILEDAISVYTNAVQCYINFKQYDKAVETADRSRSRHLADLFFASKDLYPQGEIPSEVEEYYRLQQQIYNENIKKTLATTPQQAPNSDDILEKIQKLEAEKQTTWLKIRSQDQVLAGQLQPDPLNCKDMQKLIPDAETAILNFYTTGKHTHIFLLRQNQPTQIHTCEDQGLETLQNWILNNWLKLYKENQAVWQNQIGEFLSELANRLQLKKLIEEHLKDIKELIVIPHLSLHQIPFAALPFNDIFLPEIETASDTTRGPKPQAPPQKTESKTESKTLPQQPEYLSDKFRIRIVPSCQILNFCHQRGNLETATKMGIVENATGDLFCAGYECETLANMYRVDKKYRLEYQQATISNYQNLLNEVQVLHSSHHAISDLDDSLESKLILFDGDINLGRVFTWRFQQLAEVFLSCCETNLTYTEITDDPLSIATAFLCAGAKNVVSTLWAVDELATALFCILYYQEKQQHNSRSEALRKAQFKLRNLTGDEFSGKYKQELEAYFKQKQTGENATEIIKLQGRLQSLCREKLPFVSPHYWAGFVSQGLA